MNASDPRYRKGVIIESFPPPQTFTETLRRASHMGLEVAP